MSLLAHPKACFSMCPLHVLTTVLNQPGGLPTACRKIGERLLYQDRRITCYVAPHRGGYCTKTWICCHVGSSSVCCRLHCSQAHNTLSVRTAMHDAFRVGGIADGRTLRMPAAMGIPDEGLTSILLLTRWEVLTQAS